MISLTIKVIPNARKELIKSENGRLKLYVTSPPLDGKANDAVVSFFSESLHIPKRSVVIVRGAASREKTISIDVDAARWELFLAQL